MNSASVTLQEPQARRGRARSEMTAETRAKLLALAREMFGTKGFADTSMDELTAAASLTRGALYHHFDSKTGLFKAVVDQIDHELDEFLTLRLKRLGPAIDDGWSVIRLSCRCYLEMVLEPGVQRILLKDAPNAYPDFETRPVRLHCLNSTREVFGDLLIDGKSDPGAASAATQMLVGAMGSLAQWASDPANGPDRLAMAEYLLDGLLNGMRNQLSFCADSGEAGR